MHWLSTISLIILSTNCRVVSAKWRSSWSFSESPSLYNEVVQQQVLGPESVSPGASVARELGLGHSLEESIGSLDIESLLDSHLQPENETALSANRNSSTYDAALWPAVEFLLQAPESINHTMRYLHELNYMGTWAALAQARAIAKGAGAIAPSKDGSISSSLAFTRELQFLSQLVTALPIRLGMPLTRRIILGAVLKRRQRLGRRLSQSEQAAVGLLLLQLYAVHRHATINKGIIEFFHISKAGGTSMCSLSQLNGCNTKDAGERKNCMIWLDDLPRWVSRKAHKTGMSNRSMQVIWFANWEDYRKQIFCDSRHYNMKQRGWDFYATEFTLVGGKTRPSHVQLCTNFITVLQARHPYTRLVSHMKWVYGMYQIREGMNMNRFWPNTTLAHWRKMAPAIIDNYYTRSLLGEAVFRLAAGAVTPAHGRMAMLIASQYDVLLLLEHQNQRRQALKLGLGWVLSAQDVRTRSADDLAKEVQALAAVGFKTGEQIKAEQAAKQRDTWSSKLRTAWTNSSRTSKHTQQGRQLTKSPQQQQRASLQPNNQLTQSPAEQQLAIAQPYSQLTQPHEPRAASLRLDTPSDSRSGWLGWLSARVTPPGRRLSQMPQQHQQQPDTLQLEVQSDTRSGWLGWLPAWQADSQAAQQGTDEWQGPGQVSQPVLPFAHREQGRSLDLLGPAPQHVQHEQQSLGSVQSLLNPTEPHQQQGLVGRVGGGRRPLSDSDKRGVPDDIQVLWDASGPDLLLYEHITALTRLDSIVWEVARQVLRGDPMLGLQLEHDGVKKSAMSEEWLRISKAHHTAQKREIGCGFAGKQVANQGPSNWI